MVSWKNRQSEDTLRRRKSRVITANDSHRKPVNGLIGANNASDAHSFLVTRPNVEVLQVDRKVLITSSKVQSEGSGAVAWVLPVLSGRSLRVVGTVRSAGEGTVDCGSHVGGEDDLSRGCHFSQNQETFENPTMHALE